MEIQTPIRHGEIIWTFVDGNQMKAPGVYDHNTDSYYVRGAHGYDCPWRRGGELAGSLGAVTEMLFYDDDMDVHVELYFDKDGIWAITSFVQVLRKWAPVPWREACPTE